MENLKSIVLASQLEVDTQNSLITDFSQYEEVANEWREKASQIVVKDRGQLTEMEMAKVAQKKFAEMRIKIEKRRKELKESALRRGQAIDSIARYLQSLIAPIEEHLKAQADFIKLDDARIAREAEEARLKAEEEARLKKEAEFRAEQERIRLENEKLKKEAEVRELAIRKEREEAQKKQEAIELQARKEREAKEELEKKIRMEQEEKIRLENEKRLAEQNAAKNEKYQTWLKENNYDANTMKVERNGNVFILWQKKSAIQL